MINMSPIKHALNLHCLPSYSYCALLKSLKLNEREEIGAVSSKKCSSSVG